MRSIEQIEGGRFLPKLEKQKLENLAPIQAVLDGYIDLKELSIDEAEIVFKELKNFWLDPLDGRKIKRGVMEGILSDVVEASTDLFSKDLVYKEIKKESIRRGSVVDEVRGVIQEESGSINRVVFIDDEDAYLVIGFNGKHPLLVDPHHPTRIEERRNKWFEEALQKGYWVLSKESLNNSSVLFEAGLIGDVDDR